MLQLLKWRIWTDFNILSLKSKYLINICFKLQQDTKVVLSNDIAKSVWRFLWSDSDIISFSPGRQRALPFKLRPRVTQGSWPNPDWGLESLCPDDYLFSDVFLKSTSEYSIQTDWKIPTSLLILYLSEEGTSGIKNFRNIRKRERAFSNTTTNSNLQNKYVMKEFILSSMWSPC